MLRRLFTFLSFLSLLLCFISVAMWIASYIVYRGVEHGRAAPRTATVVLFISSHGTLTISWHRFGDAVAWSLDDETGWHYEPMETNEGWSYTDYWNDSGPKIGSRRVLGFGFDWEEYSAERVRTVTVPWSAIILLTGFVGGTGSWRAFNRYRSARRTSRRLCPACGYDLRASPERCPECGTAGEAA